MNNLSQSRQVRARPKVTWALTGFLLCPRRCSCGQVAAHQKDRSESGPNSKERIWHLGWNQDAQVWEFNAR
ncbi:hypothetical protein BYT27DRAFT_7184489 [Phlegmacium glaucopus]|nr:hypothetical protein BYT27DRAFT_7184489 [Phlegmacium glaucopus]